MLIETLLLFFLSLYYKIAGRTRDCKKIMARGVAVCAKRNIVDAKHHIICAKHNFIYANSVTTFICAARGGNDVLATLEMMLTFGQMMLCLRHK